MTDLGKLSSAIVEEPDDADRWRAFADWLEEHGFTGPAGLVRRYLAGESPLRKCLLLNASMDNAQKDNEVLCWDFLHRCSSLLKQADPELISLLTQEQERILASEAISPLLPAPHDVQGIDLGYPADPLQARVTLTGDRVEAKFGIVVEGAFERTDNYLSVSGHATFTLADGLKVSGVEGRVRSTSGLLDDPRW